MNDPIQGTDSLRDVFFPDHGQEQRVSELDESERVTELEGELKAKAKDVRTDGMSDRILEALGGMLEIGLMSGVFVKVWNEAKLFQRYTDPDKYPAEETIAVSLLEHTVKSEHTPRVDVFLNDSEVPITSLEFKVSLQLALEGAVVEIKDRHIVGVRPGGCTASGTVKLGEMILATRKADPIELPGKRTFERPIRITS